MSYLTRVQSVIQTKAALRTSGTTATAGNIAVSPSSGSFSTSSNSFVVVTGVTATLVSIGNPIQISLQSDGTTNIADLNSTTGDAVIQLFDGVTNIATYFLFGIIPSLTFLYLASAGSHTFTVQVRVTAGSVAISNTALVAYELK